MLDKFEMLKTNNGFLLRQLSPRQQMHSTRNCTDISCWLSQFKIKPKSYGFELSVQQPTTGATKSILNAQDYTSMFARVDLEGDQLIVASEVLTPVPEGDRHSEIGLGLERPAVNWAPISTSLPVISSIVQVPPNTNTDNTKPSNQSPVLGGGGDNKTTPLWLFQGIPAPTAAVTVPPSDTQLLDYDYNTSELQSYSYDDYFPTVPKTVQKTTDGQTDNYDFYEMLY
jgi:hypothetical protein